MGRVAIDGLIGVVGGKLGIIVIALLLGRFGIGFPNGIGTVVPALAGAVFAATRLAGRDRTPLTGGAAWRLACVMTAVVLAVEVLFTLLALSLSGRMAEVLSDPTVLQIYAIATPLFVAVVLGLSRLMIPLFHQQELDRLAKKDRGRL